SLLQGSCGCSQPGPLPRRLSVWGGQQPSISQATTRWGAQLQPADLPRSGTVAGPQSQYWMERGEQLHVPDLRKAEDDESWPGPQTAHEDCPTVHVSEPEGGSVNISIPNATDGSETAFFVQKYNTSTSSGEDVLYSSDGDSQKFLSSFKETLSLSGGYFKVENVSKEAEGVYRIQGQMYRKCVAFVNLTVLEPSSFPPSVSGVSGAEEQPCNETKGEEPASRNLLMMLGVVLGGVTVVGVLLLVLLCKCRFRKAREVLAYLRHSFSKLRPRLSQHSGSPQDSQEYELTAVCDRNGDQARGTRNRNQDPALENGEGDLLMEDRRFTQEIRERDPLGGDTGPTQETGVALPTLQDRPGVCRN
ncbi:zinc finger protein 501-like, partial [Chelydra serpentina]